MSGNGSRRRDGLILGSLALLSLVIFSLYWNHGLNDDEGYLLGGVTRILDGQVPYRDFHHTYAPGRFYLIAGLFRLFGENLLVVRLLWVVMRIGVVLLGYGAARTILSRPSSIALALILLVAPGPWHKSFFHLFLLANMLALARLRPGREDKYALMTAGMVAGVTMLFRQDLGLFALASYGMIAVLCRWTGESWRRASVFFYPPSFRLFLSSSTS